MLERVIYDILDQGRTHINENPEFLVDYLYQFQHVPLAEARAVRDYWLDQSFHRKSLDNTTYETIQGVNVIHQYPRNDGQPQFPCWAIVLQSEGEHDDKGRFLGNDLDDDVLNGARIERNGAVERVSIGIFVYAPSPDLCRYYYRLVKFFLGRARDELSSVENGVLDSHFSGADMMPDPRYGPEYLFVRRFQVDALILESAVTANPQERGTRLGGAWVNNTEGLDVTTSSGGETIRPQVTVFGDR